MTTTVLKYDLETKYILYDNKKKFDQKSNIIKLCDKKKYESLINMYNRFEKIVKESFVDQTIIFQFTSYLHNICCYYSIINKNKKTEDTELLLKHLNSTEEILNNIILNHERTLENMSEVNKNSTIINDLLEKNMSSTAD